MSEVPFNLESVPTGIPGFDLITNGGFVRNSIVLLAGNPGTGKSTFAAKFVHEGASRYGEPGVYVSFAESKREFYSYMSQ
ncbi:MAG: hypothetical protein DRO05_07400, partial [Thermoproteota archaeon]